MIKIITTLSIAAMTALFIGCGGGGSSGGTTAGTSSVAGGGTSSTATVKNGGIFVDAAVKGLSYTCHISQTKGTTDATGRYDCAEGDTTVTFAIGTRNLGTTMIADVITPRSFFNGANRDDEILNLAQLLQTMDKDGNLNNDIELNTNDILNWQSNHTGFDSADFDTLVGNELGKPLVSETSARTHINRVLSQYGFSEIGGLIPMTSSSSSQSSVANSSSTASSSSVSGADNDDSNSLHVTDENSLRGYTIQSVNTKIGGWDKAQMTYAIDCSGNFTTTLTAKLGSFSIPPSIMIGDEISISDSLDNEYIRFDGIDDEGQDSIEWIYFRNANRDLVIDQSVSANADNWYIESITKNVTCN